MREAAISALSVLSEPLAEDHQDPALESSWSRYTPKTLQQVGIAYPLILNSDIHFIFTYYHWHMLRE
ncbi:hypothetical protein ACHQM5_027665 [Ranunculus cassubicifolius]